MKYIDLYIIFKSDILYDDVNETLFTWIINNANNINNAGYYIKLIELTSANIDTIASLNVKTLPALLIDSEVKTFGGNKIRDYIMDTVSSEPAQKAIPVPKKKTVKIDNDDMNTWILDQLNDQHDDNAHSDIDDAMKPDTIMQRTQEMRAHRDPKTPPKAPKRQIQHENKRPAQLDQDDILLDKMFDNQQITT